MKKVFLYAYDKQNLGDDLFVRTICGRYPDVQFYMWSDKINQKTFSDLPNLKVIDQDSRLVRLLHKLRPSLVSRYKGMIENRCDAVVYIGGSIFMEYPNWETISTWWEYQALNRKFYVLGANFGPWHTEAYREKMAGIFANMQDVCFRDQYSRELFRDVDTVRHAPDILFAHPMPKAAVKEKQVFVSVIDCAGRDECHGLAQWDAPYVSNMAKLLQGFLDDGHHLVLASFCKAEGDETGIAKILDAMNCSHDRRIRVLSYDGTNTDEILAEIAASESVIATRFHAMILALAADRPVLPIIYSDKTLHVLEDMDFEGAVLDLRQDVKWPSPDITGTAISAQTQQAAQKHFEKLDKILL